MRPKRKEVLKMTSKEEKPEEKKGPHLVKVQILRATFLGGRVYSPTVKEGKEGKEKPIFVSLELTPQVQAAIDQGIVKVVKE